MRPLDGITVVALEQAIAAPFATRHLADLGARVIKVERPDGGDFARGYDTRVNGLSSHFVWVNRGKESLALDIKSDHGRMVLARLLPRADVLIQNLAPGAATRLGLGQETLRATHPRLIVANISGYGAGSDRKAYDLLIQAEAGFLSVTGTPGVPCKAGISIADIAAGMYAYSAILAALIQRGRTGTGTVIEISMLEALAEWLGFPLHYTHGGAPPPPRTGAAHATIFPYGPFPTGDGEHVLLGLQNDREWRAFCTDVLGDAALATDHRYATNEARAEHREALTARITAAFASKTAAEVTATLSDAGIASAALNDMAALRTHPSLAGNWRTVATPAGPVRTLLPPARIGEPALGPVPALGEHTDAILQELGLPQR